MMRTITCLNNRLNPFEEGLHGNQQGSDEFNLLPTCSSSAAAAAQDTKGHGVERDIEQPPLSILMVT
jgi:hypothetical protein